MGIIARRRMAEKQKRIAEGREQPVVKKPLPEPKPKPTEAKAKRKVEKVPASLAHAKD